MKSKFSKISLIFKGIENFKLCTKSLKIYNFVFSEFSLFQTLNLRISKVYFHMNSFLLNTILQVKLHTHLVSLLSQNHIHQRQSRWLNSTHEPTSNTFTLLDFLPIITIYEYQNKFRVGNVLWPSLIYFCGHKL